MKKANTTSQSIFSMYAEDKKGLVGQLLIYFNRRSFDVRSLNLARTDISDLVMLKIGTLVPAHDLLPFVERLKKIAEVYMVRTFRYNLKKTAFYSMAAAGRTMTCGY